LQLKKGSTSKDSISSNESLDQIYEARCQFCTTEQQKQYFNINSGVVVTNVRKGVFLTKMEFPSELLLPINGKPINSSKDIDQAFYQLKEELYKFFVLHLMDPR
jgi:S1-C subfamily serine protease